MLWKDEQLPTMLPLSSSLLPAHGAGKRDWPCSASPAGYCLHGFMPAVLLSDLEQTLCLYPKTSVPTTALSFSVDFFSFFLKMEKQEFRILQNAPFFFFLHHKTATFWKLFSQILPCFSHLCSPTTAQTCEAAGQWALAPAHPACLRPAGQGDSSYFFTELCLVPKLPRETVLYCHYYFYTCSFKALPCLWLSVPGPMARQRQQLFWSRWPRIVQLHHFLLCSSLMHSSFLLSFSPLLSLACILLSSIHLQSIYNTTSKFISCITLTNSRLKFPLLFGCLFRDFTQKVIYIMLWFLPAWSRFHLCPHHP